MSLAMGRATEVAFRKIDETLHDLYQDVKSLEPLPEPSSFHGIANPKRRDYRHPEEFKDYLPHIPRTEEYLKVRLALYRIYELHSSLSGAPYSLGLRLELSQLYECLGYPDLAAGEAYRILLLVDEVLEDSGEYHEEALSAAKLEVANQSLSDRIQQASLNVELGDEVSAYLIAGNSQGKSDVDVQDEEAMLWTKSYFSVLVYPILARSLMACGCLRSAQEFCDRGLKIFAEDSVLTQVQQSIKNSLQEYYQSKNYDYNPEATRLDEYPERGLVRREVYPWNRHEPDRFTQESLKLLNESLAQHAPNLEVRVTELPLLDSDPDTGKDGNQGSVVKQLGVFAKRDLKPSEVILNEVSLLTANSRLHDLFCDACSAPISDVKNVSLQSEPESTSIDCEDCEDTVFCSQECHDLAQASYHPAVCGNDVEAVAKDAPAAEASDALYSLLLLRALAMACWQDVHPLDLLEVKYIWGDYQSMSMSERGLPLDKGSAADPFGNRPKTLPFTFSHNILMPLHMLEKMDINIFETSHRYDIWVFNTLYAKFRGTASARQGPDGRPEVGAVHPFWCLANHSCDPNVSWDWQGSIKFWVREQRIAYGGKSQPPGIMKGQEIFSHYCDIDLPVQDRREWAAGALGGVCMCERCIWEASETEPGKA